MRPGNFFPSKKFVMVRVPLINCWDSGLRVKSYTRFSSILIIWWFESRDLCNTTFDPILYLIYERFTSFPEDGKLETFKDHSNKTSHYNHLFQLSGI